MGQKQATLNQSEIRTALREAKARISIHRGKKVNAIAKKKKDIEGHLASGNEAMAMVHVRVRTKGRWRR